MPFAATILINSKDRKEELAVALESAQSQRGEIELLVVDDGSSDGTSDYIRERFPAARVLRLDTAHGVIQSRNYGVRNASAPIVVIVDDDCVFTDPGVVERIVAEFDDSPRIGAVASPYVDVRVAPDLVKQRAPGDGVWVSCDFRGCAHALRRDVFLDIGGYESTFIRQGEETLYVRRMLDRGFVVRLGGAPLIHHLESPKRNLAKINYYAYRNTVLTGWLATPLAALPAHWALTASRAVAHGVRRGFLASRVKGAFAGFGACVVQFARRDPVSAASFRQYRRLVQTAPAPLDEIEASLPPIRLGNG